MDEGQAFTGPDDGERQKDTEEEGGHAGQCNVHPDVASLRADEERCEAHDHPGEQSGPDDDLAAGSGCPCRRRARITGRTLGGSWPDGHIRSSLNHRADPSHVVHVCVHDASVSTQFVAERTPLSMFGRVNDADRTGSWPMLRKSRVV